jgi:hypothetical protein
MKWKLLLIAGSLLWPKSVVAMQVNLVPAISNVRHEFMPHRIGSEPVPTLYLRGCQGERVNGAFYICGDPSVRKLMVESDWPETCDLRWIKWWWQAGRTAMEADRPQYVPELLLHDGNLVDSNPKEVVNTYPDIPRDAKKLQPLDCDDGMFMPGFEQGVMLTVAIPVTQKSGEYPFHLRISAGGQMPIILSVQLTVYPFDLPDPSVDYSIFYRARLNGGEPGIDPEWRTPAQMLADLRDMVVHGIRNPGTAVGESQLDDVLALRQEAGCNNRRFLTGCCVGPQMLRDDFVPSMLPQLEADTEAYARRVVAECEGYGVEQVYSFCKDEAREDGIGKQYPLWVAARRGGLKIYGAVSGMPEKTVLACKEVLQDIVSRGGTWPGCEATMELRAAGIETYVYGRPGGACEDPEGYRRQQGLMLFNRPWIAGSMEYAYMHVWVGSKHPWDDFGCPEGDHFRSHMFAYPTIDGVVDTLQWEGFAAGVNDYRYLTLLKQLDPDNEFLIRVRDEETVVDLNAMRDECARLIVALLK